MNIASQNERAKTYLQGTHPFNLRMLLRVAWLSFIAVSLTACCTARKITPEYVHARARLNGRDLTVGYFKNVRQVQQAAPDLCWAASLEQALAHQGVDTDQKRIAERAYPKSDAAANRTMSMFGLRLDRSITDEHLQDGSEVWARTDIDGGVEGPILLSSTFVSKIYFELQRNRIPLVGISTEHGAGHVVSVIGLAFPIGTKRLTSDQVVGLLIYDPLTSVAQLQSTEELFERSVALVYVTTYDSAAGAIGGLYCSAKQF